MQVQPYLFFEGRCQEALDFYQRVLGAEVFGVRHFKDQPAPAVGDSGCAAGAAPPGDKVMHANLKVGETTLLASDGMCRGTAKFHGISLNLSAPDEAAARRLFDALADGGQVQMPMEKSFFASAFGMVSDRFGVPWMVMAEH